MFEIYKINFNTFSLFFKKKNAYKILIFFYFIEKLLTINVSYYHFTMIHHWESLSLSLNKLTLKKANTKETHRRFPVIQFSEQEERCQFI